MDLQSKTRSFEFVGHLFLNRHLHHKTLKSERILITYQLNMMGWTASVNLHDNTDFRWSAEVKRLPVVCTSSSPLSLLVSSAAAASSALGSTTCAVDLFSAAPLNCTLFAGSEELKRMAHSKARVTDGKVTYPPGVKEISDKISKEEMVRRLKVSWPFLSPSAVSWDLSGIKHQSIKEYSLWLKMWLPGNKKPFSSSNERPVVWELIFKDAFLRMPFTMLLLPHSSRWLWRPSWTWIKILRKRRSCTWTWLSIWLLISFWNTRTRTCVCW